MQTIATTQPVSGRAEAEHPLPEAAARPLRAPAAAGLVGASAPPLWLPASHFALALAFWIAGAAGLVWVAPDLAIGSFALQRVVAVAHLFTLGWITTSIMGALYQFLPVALRVPIRSERIGYASLALHAPGLAIFVGGLIAGSHPTLLTGAALFGSGLLLFAANLAATLRRAPQRNVTWWALTGATVSLVSTVALGASLAGNLRWGYLGEDRFLALGVHVHVAAAGWVLLVMVGVAHRLLPMFLLSHGASERPGRLAVALLAAGVALLLGAHHALTAALIAVIAVLLVAGVLAFIVQAALYFRHRRKPALDPGLRLAAVGLGLLAVAIALVPPFLTQGVASPGLATAYGLALVGSLSLFVAGHHYKIVPFLVWFHRYGPRVGKGPVPRVADLYDARPANAAVALLASGALGLVAAALAGHEAAARPAALLFLAGALVLAAQVTMILGRRPE